MKHLLLITLFALASLFCSKIGNGITGTADDTNSGSIFGMLLTKDSTSIKNTVTVALYALSDTANGLSKRAEKSREPIKTVKCSDGSYEFDSLAAGTYGIIITRDSIVIGKEEIITLDEGEHKEINITVVVLIKQTINIWNTDNSQSIIINNIYMENGTIEKQDSGYVLTAAESDTLIFKIDIEKDDDTSTVTALIIRNEDGSSNIEIIDSEDKEVKVTITPGTGPATGYLGEITINIKETGTAEIESVFDTTGVPVKSR
jgi:hypothetical protein